MIKIISKSNYRDVFITGDRLIATKGFLKSENLLEQLVFVGIKSYEVEGSSKTAAGGLAGALLYGIVGMLSGLFVFRPKIEAIFALYLEDGRILEIYTDDIRLAKLLLPYMETKKGELRWK